MRTTSAFNDCGDALETQVRAYWASKQRQLEDLLKENISDADQLDLTVHYQRQTRRYEVRAVLALAAATLTVEAGDRDVIVALDRVREMLIQAVQHHNEGAAQALTAARDSVDETSEDSFPASDAPSWTPVIASGPPDPKR